MTRIVVKIGKGLLAALAAVVVLAVAALLFTQAQISWLETEPVARGATGTFHIVNGKTLHVQTLGDPTADPTGAPLVLIHGAEAPGSLDWFPWVERFKGRRSVILIDQVGFGHSERRTVPGPELSVAARARDVLTVADILGVTTFDLVGFSYGGHVAAEVALTAPDRLRKLVFMDAAIYVRAMPAAMTWPLIGRAIAWYGWGGAPFGVWANRCSQAKQPGNTCPWLKLARVTGTADAMVAAFASGALDPTLGERVAKITTPSLVVWGGADAAIPVKDGDRLAQALHANIIIVAKAGHWVHQDAPDRAFDVVIRFLGG